MPENNNEEYKQSWNDEYLKTVCAFANTQGGTLFIGKDDNGNSVDVSGHTRLMETIPQKIKSLLGITAEIILHDENGIHTIEIQVHPYSVAISYHSKYYTRVGSTTTELTGHSLTDFLLKKSGRTWDDSIEDRATLNDIDPNSISSFLEAAKKAGRLPETDGLTKIELLQKLRVADGDKLKRSAIILFGKDPGKFYPNLSVKIGRFRNDSDLDFHEEEEGNLIKLLPAVTNQLNRKFFTNPIDFEGLQRVEKGEYPVAAVREMLLNALVHKNYMGSTIQIRLYDDKFSVWNEGTLPQGLTFEALKRQHPSRPHNPIIADVCFKGGYIDAWGRGTLKIIDSCKEASLPEPEMKAVDGGILITLFKDTLNEEKLRKLGLNDRQVKAVIYVKANGKITNKQYRELSSLSDEGARLDLNQLVSKEIFSIRRKGRSSFYVIKSLGN